jgi:hypothetical protein
MAGRAIGAAKGGSAEATAGTRPRRPSPDCNANGIPDECEGGGQGGGHGGGGPGGGPGGAPTAGEESWPGPGAETDPDNEAAWAEFFAWFIVQDWGPDADTTGAEQHQMMVDKLEELGLTNRRPVAVGRG